MDRKKTALFREVNDSMNELLIQFAAEERADFFCECPSRDCARRVALTRREYEAIRGSGGFLVSPDCRPWARPLLRTSRYVVVADFRARLEPVKDALEPLRDAEASESERSPRGPSRTEPSPTEPTADPGSAPKATSDSMVAA
jgi:hypothetical protein